MFSMFMFWQPLEDFIKLWTARVQCLAKSSQGINTYYPVSNPDNKLQVVFIELNRNGLHDSGINHSGMITFLGYI